jgi:hypothetical protein
MAMHASSRCVAVCLSLCLLALPAEAAKQPIKKLTLDPQAPAVDLFAAIEEGTIETTVIARSSNEANLFVTNNSSAPLSVKIPPAVVAVQVLKQAFGQPGGVRNQGQGNNGPGQGGNMGQAQSVGGGMNGNMFGNGQQNNMNGNGPTIGFFSVPSHKTVQVPLKTVCLSHGRPDPRPRMKYKLVKLEDYTSDAALQETLKLVATSESDLQSLQAAVWHLTDKMSWKDLRAKQIERLGGHEPLPYFSDSQIEDAEALIDRVREKTKDVPRKIESAAR